MERVPACERGVAPAGSVLTTLLQTHGTRRLAHKDGGEGRGGEEFGLVVDVQDGFALMLFPGPPPTPPQLQPHDDPRDHQQHPQHAEQQHRRDRAHEHFQECRNERLDAPRGGGQGGEDEVGLGVEDDQGQEREGEGGGEGHGGGGGGGGGFVLVIQCLCFF